MIGVQKQTKFCCLNEKFLAFAKGSYCISLNCISAYIFLLYGFGGIFILSFSHIYNDRCQCDYLTIMWVGSQQRSQVVSDLMWWCLQPKSSPCTCIAWVPVYLAPLVQMIKVVHVIYILLTRYINFKKNWIHSNSGVNRVYMLFYFFYLCISSGWLKDTAVCHADDLR